MGMAFAGTNEPDTAITAAAARKVRMRCSGRREHEGKGRGRHPLDVYRAEGEGFEPSTGVTL